MLMLIIDADADHWCWLYHHFNWYIIIELHNHIPKYVVTNIVVVVDVGIVVVMVIAILLVPCLPTYSCIVLGITTIHFPSLFNWYVITDMHNHTPKVCRDWHSSGRWCYRCVVVVVITPAIRDQHLPFGIHITEALLLEAAILAILRFKPSSYRDCINHISIREASHTTQLAAPTMLLPIPLMIHLAPTNSSHTSLLLSE